jgi:hypothetical protein
LVPSPRIVRSRAEVLKQVPTGHSIATAAVDNPDGVGTGLDQLVRPVAADAEDEAGGLDRERGRQCEGIGDGLQASPFPATPALGAAPGFAATTAACCARRFDGAFVRVKKCIKLR